jgi:large subunit ribosomal protein L13
VKTFVVKTESIQRDWYLVDAEGKTLGRIASQVAHILRGKHKPTYSPSVDVGDHVIIVNAEKIHVTGNKMDAKQYYRYSGYMGGLHSTTLSDLLRKHPDRVLLHAIRGMLPKTHLGRAMIKKLKVYAGSTHPHEAQKPKVLPL